MGFKYEVHFKVTQSFQNIKDADMFLETLEDSCYPDSYMTSSIDKVSSSNFGLSKGYSGNIVANDRLDKKIRAEILQKRKEQKSEEEDAKD